MTGVTALVPWKSGLITCGVGYGNFTQGDATDCDYFQIAVLANWVERKKHKKAGSISNKMQFKASF